MDPHHKRSGRSRTGGHLPSSASAYAFTGFDLLPSSLGHSLSVQQPATSAHAASSSAQYKTSFGVPVRSLQNDALRYTKPHMQTPVPFEPQLYNHSTGLYSSSHIPFIDPLKQARTYSTLMPSNVAQDWAQGILAQDEPGRSQEAAGSRSK